MFLFSLILFAACLLVIAVAFARGLAHADDILLVVGPDEQAPAPRPAISSRAPAPATWPLAARSPTIPFYTPPASDPSADRS